ncbi:probable disease resistance protein At4g27220 isoform X4 [Trifolium pratense]|uniref:probable disease resistance protein At4g27220 isoform X4 n=1 Tax=Trifolium pratense TaxID=57577 RepID=UPI001E696F10|nr:probable disease resistance protein At4g27220 isoform X4 [Trifolium pratense]
MCLGKILMMGRSKHEHLWIHVTKVENGRKWICKHCDGKFSGGASRIKTHLGRKGGGGIRQCSNYHANDQGIHNMASTSNNSQGVINRVYSTQDQGRGSIRSIFESEISQLKQLVLDLECEENVITKQLQWLESRGKKCKLKVNVWLKKLQEMKGITVDTNNLNDANVISELIQNMKRHKEEKPLTLSTEYVGLELDKNIHKVLKLLDDDKVFIIGIYGMGGVGKTLLATLVENEVKRKTTFKNVFWITVSNITNISKLQHDIAKRIGVKLDEDDERIRAYNLSSALEKTEKSILILDDVWKYIDLEKVGIHPKVNGIKVIVTSRLKHVCHQMDCQPNVMIGMFPLSRYNEGEYDYADEDEYDVDEGWDLFMINLGHDGTPRILPYEIENVARCIVKRFEGLPLGIKVMARTMKGINDIHRWKHAFNKLNKVETGQELEEEVFKVLKRSYDNLKEKDLQNCFLYCAIILSDEIGCDDYELIMKLVDNGLIDGNRCLEEISDEVKVMLIRFGAHSLDYTHRLVKDMACYILKESKRNAMLKFNKELTEIPPIQEWEVDLEIVHFARCLIKEIPEGMSPYCPRLSILIINLAKISDVPESFFEYMNSLTILDLSYNYRLESLPNSITKSRSLVSLLLKECSSLKHVPPLGELLTLSRLVITESSIEEAPQGLDKLLNLNWLDLCKNKSLNFEFGTLSNLTKMQYLDLRDTRVVIRVEDIQGMNKLERLGGIFDIKDYHNYVQNMPELKMYYLIFRNVSGESRRYNWSYGNDLQEFYEGGESTRVRTIHFEDCENFSCTLPNDFTRLGIYGNIHWLCLCDALSYNTSSSLYAINIKSYQQLQSLFCLLTSCSFCTEIKYQLQVLVLNSLESLTGFYKDVGVVGQSLSLWGIFDYLVLLNISNCNSIETLLTPALVQQLQNLDRLFVSSCASMKEIFAVSNNDENESSFIALPKLTYLQLLNLPQLKIVCKRSICCGSSKPSLNINSCPDLERHPTVKLIDCEIPYFGIFTTDIDPQLMLLDTLVNLQ